MEKEGHIIIKNLIENFLNKLDVEFDEININLQNNDNIRFAIISNDSGILIGNEGNNIKALNYLIKQMVWKKDSEEIKDIKFFIDVNDYQSKNIERIREKTLKIAEKVVVFKRDVEMEPMSSFERMIVHSTLTDNPKVTTESSGDGIFRRIHIKFKGDL